MMLIDSCILIDMSRQNAAALDFILSLAGQPSISSLTAMEVVRGVKKAEEQALLDRIFADWRMIPVDLTIALRAAELLRVYNRSHGVGAVDAVIAATAQVHDLPLVTLNLKHFPMFPNLERPY